MQIAHHNYVTCLARLNKQIDDEKAQQVLIVGTEQNQVLFIAPSGTAITETVELAGTPVALFCEGVYDTDYVCCVACRNGCVYVLSKS